MASKLFNDVIHGHIEFHPLVVYIIDTPQFQRLRNIKQTGPCYFVYPGAIHTRFEHSLGTCFLAGKLMEALNKKSNLYDEKRRKETLCVQIAGLCHDLGHGPFSHTWEKFLERCDIKWKHEEMSIKIFEEILKETVPDKSNPSLRKEITIIELFRRYGMEEYISKVKKIILGDPSEDKENSYLYQIISNSTNGIDVDKWDYLMRDSKMINFPITFDCYRMIHCCQILETSPKKYEICFRDKECATLIDMFLSRGLLHDKVYQHRKLKIIEEMLLDAFYLAKDRLRLTLVAPDDFLKLTDHIYQKILYDDFGNDKNMLEAKKILGRISKRNLYICIAAKVTKESVSKSYLEKVVDAMHENLLKKGCKVERNAISCVKIDVHMTKYNKKELLRDVMVYPKQIHEEEMQTPTNFEADKLSSMKLDLKNMNRTEILILYKGEDMTECRNYDYNDVLSRVLKEIDREEMQYQPPEKEIRLVN